MIPVSPDPVMYEAYSYGKIQKKKLKTKLLSYLYIFSEGLDCISPITLVEVSSDDIVSSEASKGTYTSQKKHK